MYTCDMYIHVEGYIPIITMKCYTVYPILWPAGMYLYYGVYLCTCTVLNLILRMEKNNFNFENARFSGKGSQSLTYTHYENKMLISCVKLDHYSICIVHTCRDHNCEPNKRQSHWNIHSTYRTTLYLSQLLWWRACTDWRRLHYHQHWDHWFLPRGVGPGRREGWCSGRGTMEELCSPTKRTL